MKLEQDYHRFIAEFESLKYLSHCSNAFVKKNYEAVLNSDSAIVLALEIRRAAIQAGGDAAH